MMLALCIVTIFLTGVHVCQVAASAAVCLSERLEVLTIFNMRLVVPTAACMLC
jgi:hypothetical protein